MKKLILWFQGIFPLLHNMLLPALITTGGVLFFYAHDGLTLSARQSFHIIFYFISFAVIILLFYFNSNKGIFFILSLLIGYTCLNRIKYNYPEDFLFMPEYINLCFFMPIALLIFGSIPENKLLTKSNIYFLLLFFAVYAFGELSSHGQLSITTGFLPTGGSISGLSLIIFILCNIYYYIRTIIYGKILDYSFFFASLLCLFGFYYSEHSSGAILFFTLSVLIIFLGLAEEIHNNIYKDNLTGFASRNAFVIHSKKFPLKYSVGLIRIDNYTNLHKAFGKHGRKNLIRMISERISSVGTNALIYRYGEDELVAIFKNEGKNIAFEQMEQIRRSVASADFYLRKHKKPIKLTISGCVSEKKRSDINTLETLTRVRKSLQKTSSFSCNITSKV
ncbi:MAG: GGDEF domain-containing protein [Alphaproteobacteria bacterium]|nr:GGDEF domain-containing protein [Alphaproteobacteria bacterium]